MAYLEVYKDESKANSWRWRRIAGNGRIIEVPGEGFTRRWSAKRSAKRAHPHEQIRIVS